MRLPLGPRILAWSAAGTTATVTAILLLVDSSFQATVRRDVEQQITATTQLASELLAARFRDLLDRGSALAMHPVLRGSVETGDRATVAASLHELRAWAGTDWLMVLRPSGEMLAASGPAPADAPTRARAILAQAPYYDTGDLWSTADGLVEVVASMIYFAETPLGVLLAGSTIDQQTVETIEQATLQWTAFLSAGRIVAGSTAIAPDTRDALGHALRGERVAGGPVDPHDDARGRRKPHTLELAGEPFLVAGAPLLDAGGAMVGEIIHLRSIKLAMAPVRRLRVLILSVAGVGLLLAAFWSWLLSRSVTRPIDRLLDDARRMGEGDLDQPVAAVGSDEIGTLATGFENMRNSLRDAREQLLRNERMSAIGHAAGAIVHDFAQPITVLMGYVQLLDGATDENTRSESTNVMRSELERLRGMMNEILEFTRGEKQLMRLPVSVPLLVDTVVRSLAPGLGQHNIRLRAQHGFDGEWALDTQRMSRVLYNLVGNAAQAIGQDGEITIRTTRMDDMLHITVSDNGPGIPAAIRDTLFEPFVTAGKKGGTGLGLAIVKNIIDGQGGRIDVHTSEGGTTFIMEIPEHVPTEAAPAAPTAGSAGIRAAAAAAAMILALLAGPQRTWAQTTFSGQVDLVAKSDADAMGVNRTLRGSVYNEFRLRGFIQSWPTETIGFFGEVMYDGRYGTPFVVGAYFVINEIGGHDWLNARAGLAPSLIGNFGQRSNYFKSNPLIGVPLVWSYMTTLHGTGMETIESLGMRRATNQRTVPTLYDACWNMQWELLGEVGIFEYSIGVTPASLSNPRANGYDGVQLIGRLGAEPAAGLRVGASGGIGPYIGVTPTSTDPVVENPEDYDQRLIGIDIEYGRGRAHLFAEVYTSAWEMPLIASDLELWSGYVEGRFTLSPGLYLAARLDQMTFSTIETGPGQRFRWDDDLWRSEIAVGYRLAREVLLKLDWQHTRTTTGARRRQDLFALQLSAAF